MLDSDWAWPDKADDLSGQGRGGASDAGLGGGEGDGGILPVLTRRLLDQAIVLYLEECTCTCI